MHKYTHPRVQIVQGRRTHTTRMTIAYRWVDEDVVEYNISICAPTDRFVKAIGRKLASDRLENEPARRCKIKEKGSTFQERLFESVISDLLSDPMKDNELPFRFNYSDMTYLFPV